MSEELGATPEVDELPIENVVEEQPKSMDDTIRETLRSLQDKGTEEAPLDDVEKAQRIRDEKGKFKAKEEQAAEVTPETAPTDPTLEAPAEVLQPPNTWKKEAKAEWAKLSPNVQAEVIKRENDIYKGIEQYKNDAQLGVTMQRSLAPYMATIQSLGVQPDVAVTELLKTDHTLRYGNEQQKLAMVQGIFQAYGINPQSAFEYFQNGAPQVDPNVSALQQRLQQLEGVLQQQQSIGQQQEQQSLTSEIEKFKSDPSHSHFESVKGHMSALLQAGQANDLQDAYEQAIYANPTTRTLVLAEQQAKERAEATQKAQAAKAAASVNVRTRPSMPVSQPIGSMDDTIRATLRKIQGS